MNGSWAHPYAGSAGQTPDAHRRMHRASTAPISAYPSHPHSLLPGHMPAVIDRPNLYFLGARQYDYQSGFQAPPTVFHATLGQPFSPNTQPPLPPPVPPLPPALRSSNSPPPLPPLPRSPLSSRVRSSTSPPPIPPKPSSSYPQTSQSAIPRADSGAVASGQDVQGTAPAPPDETDELALALALSQSESKIEESLRRELEKEEEEQLARALEESRMISDLPLAIASSSVASTQKRSSYGPRSSAADIFGDEELARRLEEEERFLSAVTSQERSISPSMKSLSRPSSAENGPSLKLKYKSVTVDSNLYPNDSGSRNDRLPDEHLVPHGSPEQDLAVLPEYKPRDVYEAEASTSTAVNGPMPHDGNTHSPSLSNSSQPSSINGHTLDSPGIAHRRPTSARVSSLPPYVTDEPPQEQNVTSSSSSSADTDRNSLTITIGCQAVEQSSRSVLTASRTLPRILSSSSLSVDREVDLLPSPELSPHPGSTVNSSAVNLNQYVDQELLTGVSIGFNTPTVSPQLVPMREVMPNIISLPHGRCPPLHIHAPSWRHLLKLMARLSVTRMQATVEAMAISKTDFKLRTVIQFIKPHHASSDWRTILYFTIDYLSPNSASSKLSVNDLPYSYSLSSIPTLLRDAADTPISKTYTVPATDAVPYPKLPITFPDLAIYLHAVLEDSRRYMHDNTSGIRKLAKMVDACYPRDEVFAPYPDRTSMGGLFKRVIGRNPKPSRRGGNEDTYELVTPFVADEWG